MAVARMIGKTGSWLWWVMGAICALLFGHDTGFAQTVAKYGVALPPIPVTPRPAVPAEQRTKAEEIIRQYLDVPAITADADKQKEIDALIAQLGTAAADQRAGLVDKLAACGQAALPALRTAAQGKGQAMLLASQAVGRIETTVRANLRKQLAALGAAGDAVVREKLAASRTELSNAATEAQKQEIARAKVKAELSDARPEDKTAAEEALQKADAAVAAAKAKVAAAQQQTSLLQNLLLTPQPAYGIAPPPPPQPAPVAKYGVAPPQVRYGVVPR